MRDSAYCRSQARRCRELATAIGDPGMIEHLRLIAEEYEAEADRIDSDGSASDPARPSNPIIDQG